MIKGKCTRDVLSLQCTQFTKLSLTRGQEWMKGDPETMGNIKRNIHSGNICDVGALLIRNSIINSVVTHNTAKMSYLGLPYCISPYPVYPITYLLR